LVGLEKARVEKKLAELRKAEPGIARLNNAWTVIFRSSDPTIWNTATNKGRDRFAVPLSRSRPGIKYLRLTEPSKNRSVIIEMTAQRLDEISDRNGYGWNGTSKRGLKANHLGIYNAS